MPCLDSTGFRDKDMSLIFFFAPAVLYSFNLRSMLLSYFQEELIEAGCDEAGRGCLAGPVFAAAVILPKDFYHPLLNDSKKPFDYPFGPYADSFSTAQHQFGPFGPLKKK